MYNRAVFVLALFMIVAGFGILIRTANGGGGTVGYVVGALFIALGAARIHLLRRQRGA
jgi:hypothetical protein